jgi:hypothetical protein
MTGIPFFAVKVPAAQGDDSLPQVPAPPPSSKDLNADFLSLISQIFGDANTAKTAETDKSSDETTPAAPATSADKTKKKTALDDPATPATIMAMQAPPVLPLPEIPKPAPPKGPSVKPITAKDEPTASNVAPQPPEKAEKTEKAPATVKPVPIAPAANAPATTVETKPEPVTDPASPAQSAALATVVPLSGTGDALGKDGMKFVAEKKEIAGRATQKVPTVSLSRSPAVSALTTAAIDPVSGASNAKSGGQPVVVMDWPAKPSQWNVAVTPGAVAASPETQPAAQVERVTQMISDQAATIRQSGANNLGVSLKVDAHTELFLQLTNHGGQIQASLRFERGSAAGLDSHWGELQQSLAKQNVQLLPRDEKVSAATATTSNFDQPSSNSQRQTRSARTELPEAVSVKPVSITTQAKTQTVSRQGWESWA